MKVSLPDKARFRQGGWCRRGRLWSAIDGKQPGEAAAKPPPPLHLQQQSRVFLVDHAARGPVPESRPCRCILTGSFWNAEKALNQGTCPLPDSQRLGSHAPSWPRGNCRAPEITLVSMVTANGSQGQHRIMTEISISTSPQTSFLQLEKLANGGSSKWQVGSQAAGGRWQQQSAGAKRQVTASCDRGQVEGGCGRQ